MTDKIEFTRQDAERLVRVEEQNNSQIATLEEIKTLLQTQNGRVRTLEKRQNYSNGAVAVLTAVFAGWLGLK